MFSGEIRPEKRTWNAFKNTSSQSAIRDSILISRQYSVKMNCSQGRSAEPVSLGSQSWSLGRFYFKTCRRWILGDRNYESNSRFSVLLWSCSPDGPNRFSDVSKSEITIVSDSHSHAEIALYLFQFSFACYPPSEVWLFPRDPRLHETSFVALLVTKKLVSAGGTR